MARIMITALNINWQDGPTEYELTPAAHRAIQALGYQLKNQKQPETDGQ